VYVGVGVGCGDCEKAGSLWGGGDGLNKGEREREAGGTSGRRGPMPPPAIGPTRNMAATGTAANRVETVSQWLFQIGN